MKEDKKEDKAISISISEKTDIIQKECLEDIKNILSYNNERPGIKISLIISRITKNNTTIENLLDKIV